MGLGVAFRPRQGMPYMLLLALAAMTCMVTNEGEKAGKPAFAPNDFYACSDPVTGCGTMSMAPGSCIYLSAYPFQYCNQLYKTNYMSVQSLSLTAGIVTSQLHACKQFYTSHFGFQVIYESDWFVLLATPDGKQQISFLQPEHPTQQALFQPAFAGRGVYFTLEVPDVEAEYERIKKAGITVLIDLRKEPWGDTHFAIQDPAGVAVDIVTYQAPE